jgi:signal transduction histidine kinase
MTLRHTSIRTRMFLLVSVPLLALIAIYAYAVVGQFGTAVGLANAGKVSGTTITPISDAMVALNAERNGAVLYLATRSSQSATAYRQEQAATDRQFRTVETITRLGPVTANATPLERAAAATFVKDGKGKLQALRTEVTSGGISRTVAINEYSAIMADGLRVGEQAIQQTYVSQSLATTARQEVNLYTAEMLVLEENAIYSGDVAAGHLPAADQKEFAQLAAVRQYLVADAVPQLDAEAGGLLRQEVPASLTAALTSQENAIINAPANATGSVKPPVPLTVWQPTAVAYASHLEVVLTKSPAWIQSQVTSSARQALTTFIVAASVGLLAVIASIVFSFLMGRRLLRRLDALRQSALELARERLPSVMARLRDGDPVDVDAEAPPIEAGPDEIDQVREAFNTVHRAAVEAAVDEANLRRGVSQVFRNLARRNQALLHRQLGLLDSMERRAEEPEQLEDLFRIDHLTTRMRRHAEGLIVLSGDSPGRGWSRPVPFIDVLRAAVSEVEDYTRIRVEVRSKAALAGPAVADVVHLLAELIENATVFSPPNTMVRVQGELVGRGFAVEIEDRGLGIGEERLEEINRDLTGLPAFDLAGSDRLGLFITGRLAHRHGIKVSLRSSVYGGTSAVVIIPTSLVVADDAVAAAPALAAGVRTLQPAVAAAALSSGNGHAGNGHADTGYAGNGYAGNGLSGSEHAAHELAGNDFAGNGHPGNGHAGNGHAENGHPDNGFAGNGLLSTEPGSTAHLITEPAGDALLSTGPASNAHLTTESPGDAHLSTGPADEGLLGDGPAGNGHGASAEPRRPRHAAGPRVAIRPEDTQPFQTGSSGAPADSGWWSRSTLASRQAADSIQAGQAVAGAIELVPGPEADPVAGQPDGGEPDSGQPDGGLPVRVRQAALAPQLRDRDPADSGEIEAPAPAEAFRSTMSAMQSGWERARSVAGTPSADASPDATASADQNPADSGE